jgi:hypothetical protein
MHVFVSCMHDSDIDELYRNTYHVVGDTIHTLPIRIDTSYRDRCDSLYVGIVHATTRLTKKT